MLYMFGFFKKKKEEAPAVQLVREEPKENISLEKRVLRHVAELIPKTVLEGEKLQFPDCGGLTMRVEFPDLDGPQFRMEAILEHPDFFGPLVESTAGVKEGDEEKARFAARQIVDSVLDALLPALRGEGEAAAPVELWGRTHRFKASVSGVLLINAQEPPERRDLWSRMEQAVLDCLGTQKVYWVKLYMAHINGGDTSCEVRINGWVVPELTETLVQIAKEWPLEGMPVRSAKQYIVLVQDGDTCPACPYTWEQVKGLTRQAIRLFEGGAKYDQIPKELEKSSPDLSLAEDVFGFLPELMAQVIWSQVKVTSQFSVSRHGAGQTSVWFTQCRAWAPVYSAIMDHLHEDQPDKDQLLSIAGASAMCHALSNAVNNGSKLEDLMMSQAFMVSKDYQLW
ncbi:hypothetical protein N510_000411 [Firmicutes bacterium ASF500]|nr:hypothetical protein N510_000411 [Firmicutes bacterium ASF500]